MRLSRQLISGVSVRVKDDELSPDARAAWLHMRDEGGWYTATRLGAEVLPDASKGLRGRSAGRWLGALFKRGYVVRREWTDCVVYGVTSACYPIPGETLDPAPITTVSAATA